MFPQFLNAPAAWIGLISGILGIIAFFLPNGDLVYIDNSTNFYFPESRSNSNDGSVQFFVFLSFITVFYSFSQIHAYFTTIASVLFAISMWRYKLLHISYILELLNGGIFLLAAFLLNFLPQNIIDFWNQMQTFNSKDLYGKTEFSSKISAITEQIFIVFSKLSKGDYLAISLVLEILLVSAIFGHFLGGIFKTRKNIKPTRKSSIIFNIITLGLLFLLIIYFSDMINFFKAWNSR